VVPGCSAQKADCTNPLNYLPGPPLYLDDRQLDENSVPGPLAKGKASPQSGIAL